MDYITIHRILQGIQLTAAILIGLEWVSLAARGHAKGAVLRAYDTICMHARQKRAGCGTMTGGRNFCG